MSNSGYESKKHLNEVDVYILPNHVMQEFMLVFAVSIPTVGYNGSKKCNLFV